MMTRRVRWAAVACLALSLLPAGAGRAEIISASLGVRGMTCSICSSSVERRLRKLHFVESACVDLGRGLTDLVPRPGKRFDGRRLLREVHRAGFTPGVIRVVAEGPISRAGGSVYLAITPDQTALLRGPGGGPLTASLPASGAVRVQGRFADPSGDERASVAIEVESASTVTPR